MRRASACCPSQSQSVRVCEPAAMDMRYGGQGQPYQGDSTPAPEQHGTGPSSPDNARSGRTSLPDPHALPVTGPARPEDPPHALPWHARRPKRRRCVLIKRAWRAWRLLKIPSLSQNKVAIIITVLLPVAPLHFLIDWQEFPLGWSVGIYTVWCSVSLLAMASITRGEDSRRIHCDNRPPSQASHQIAGRHCCQ